MSDPEPRTCKTCGGRVDVVAVPKEPAAPGPAAHIGACERCGDWFDDDELDELAGWSESRNEQKLHY